MSLEHVSDIKALVDAGDVVLADERAKFKKHIGRDMKLDDEQLIRALALTEDDDDELFCQNVLNVERGE